LKGRILGIDHIGLSGLNIFKNTPFFNTFQYEKVFSESNLRIFDEIKPFLSTEITSHDAMFLKNKNGISIEMVDYHKNNLSQGRYNVIIEWSSELFPEKFTSDDDDEIVKSLNGKLGNIKKSKIPQSNIPFYFLKGTNHGITSIVLEVTNMEKSLSLWQEIFNFEIESGGNQHFNSLVLSSPISNWNLKLILIENNKLQKSEAYLDSFGWNCISLITTDIESEIKSLKERSDIECGLPYFFEIGGKKYKLLFIKGFDAEIIELIQPTEP